jgi:hypothetical protein
MHKSLPRTMPRTVTRTLFKVAMGLSELQVVSDAQFRIITGFIDEHMPWCKGLVFSGLYTDISPNWYRYVGDKLFTTFIIQNFVILIKTLVTYGVDRFLRLRAFAEHTQPDMNKYAFLLNGLFCRRVAEC